MIQVQVATYVFDLKLKNLDSNLSEFFLKGAHIFYCQSKSFIWASKFMFGEILQKLQGYSIICIPSLALKLLPRDLSDVRSVFH